MAGKVRISRKGKQKPNRSGIKPINPTVQTIPMLMREGVTPVQLPPLGR